MKIDEVSLTLFAWDDIPATRYGHHTGQFAGSSTLGLLTIRRDDGVEGHAFLGSAANGGDMDGPGLIKHLKPLIMGEDPLDREKLYARLWSRNRYCTLRAIGAVDVALWDLAAKAANMPLYKMLGAYRDKVPAYASSAVMSEPGAYADEARQYREGGWAAYKIHPPTQWRTDIKVCEAVRRSVGDDYTIMLDSTWSYNYEAAIKVGRAVEGLGFHWYEDPLADDDMYNCIKLREKLDIPLMATEYSPGGFTSYVPWILNKATDYLRGDVAVKGGITSILKTAHLAQAFAMNFEVHHGGNSLNNYANLHVILAIANCQFFEVLLPSGAQKYAIIDDLEPDAEGFIHAPTGPGLGANIDFELIADKKQTVLR
jgi:L-alanine-DL-glutamate epimerase-like enolase superfamily enzyme